MYWECVREYFEPDGSIQHHRLRVWFEEGRQGTGACETVPAPAVSRRAVAGATGAPCHTREANRYARHIPPPGRGSRVNCGEARRGGEGVVPRRQAQWRGGRQGRQCLTTRQRAALPLPQKERAQWMVGVESSGVTDLPAQRRATDGGEKLSGGVGDGLAETKGIGMHARALRVANSSRGRPRVQFDEFTALRKS